MIQNTNAPSEVTGKKISINLAITGQHNREAAKTLVDFVNIRLGKVSEKRWAAWNLGVFYSAPEMVQGDLKAIWERQYDEGERDAWFRFWLGLSRPYRVRMDETPELRYCHERTEALLKKQSEEFPDVIRTGDVPDDPEPIVRHNWHTGGIFLRPKLAEQKLFLAMFQNLKRARICQNSKCPTPFFLYSSPQQKSCCADCGDSLRRESKTRWWNMVGQKNRQRKRANRRVRTKPEVTFPR